MRSMGVDRAEVATVVVGAAGGPEAAARQARYAALDSVATAVDAAAVLLGHTRDDQAETVLLGLTRGSGSRSLSGMARRSGRYRRPLLDLARTDTIAACRAESIDFWDDPHNDDPAFTRVRIRRRVLPVLEAEAGPGVAAALARTAGLLREDADALDAIAGEALAAARDVGGLRVDVLAGLPSAVRRRVLRAAAVEAGCPPAELFQRHVAAVDALVTGWRGQRGVDLPGRIRARRVRTDGGGMLQLADRAVAR
jgi:tRNA(Ile)-lysidine synthase